MFLFTISKYRKINSSVFLTQVVREPFMEGKRKEKYQSANKRGNKSTHMIGEFAKQSATSDL